MADQPLSIKNPSGALLQSQWICKSQRCGASRNPCTAYFAARLSSRGSGGCAVSCCLRKVVTRNSSWACRPVPRRRHRSRALEAVRSEPGLRAHSLRGPPGSRTASAITLRRLDSVTATTRRSFRSSISPSIPAAMQRPLAFGPETTRTLDATERAPCPKRHSTPPGTTYPL